MPDILYGHLSRIAQQSEPTGLVLRLETGPWVLRVPGRPDLGLGDTRGSADQALRAMVRARRAAA